MATSRRRRSPAAWARGSRLRLAFVVTVAALLFGAGLLGGMRLARPPKKPDLPRALTATTTPPPPRRPPSPPPAPARPPGPRQGGPRVALVIDDLGRSVADVETLDGLGVPLTYAVLPFESRTAEVVAALRKRKAELICHLPMEAKGGNNPGPGALLASMTPGQLAQATRDALAAVPGAVGVNNHMGSAIASRREAITAVLEVVESSGLYFLDSRTSADTQAYEVALTLGVPAAERQVFLDADRDPAAIRAQLDRLFALARERGEAVAIAHPYPETLALLATAAAEAKAAGVELVTLSALLDRG